MSRSRENMRKAVIRASKEFTNTLIEISKEYWPKMKPPKGMTRVFRNNQFIVEVFDNETDPFDGMDAVKVLVRHNTGKPVVQWSHLQDIKNQIFGEEALAVQYLPPVSKLVDQANMYWFFVRRI